MMSDWYTDGMEKLIQETVNGTGVTDTDVRSVYAFLFELGLIDYDVEKDVIRERYGDDDE